jgi:pyruvate dehydrogenase E2 component (dihydrolipoamide acetyltransferase)
MRTIAVSATLGCLLALGSIAGCYDDEPVQPAHAAGGSTVVVSRPGIASPQPVAPQAPAQSSPPIINNVVQPAPAPAPVAPAAPPAPGTTVNMQPHTVVVPQ